MGEAGERCGGTPCRGSGLVHMCGSFGKDGREPCAEASVSGDFASASCLATSGHSSACAGKAMIRRVIHAHLNEVRFCYERSLVRAPTLAGRVSIRFRLDASGAVNHSEVADTTLASAEVGTCIAQAFRHFEFPALGGEVEVTYPFQLTSE